jgi:flagellar protein FlaG
MAILGSKLETITPTLPVAASADRVVEDGSPAATEHVVRRVAPLPSAARPPAVDIGALREQISRRLEEYLRESGRSLEFRVDDSANATVITVRRADTGEVVRQYPTEEALALLRRLNEQSGTLLEVFA